LFKRICCAAEVLWMLLMEVRGMGLYAT